jgi:DNA-binding MarR family transcriptional regulator
LSEPDNDTAVLFAFFNEVAIIGQLAGSLFERRLPEGFLVSHFGVLNHLARLGDGKTPLALARAFQVPKTTMTHTLAGLEKAGLIRFAPNPKDGRSKCVMLTDPGRGFRDEAIARLGPDLQAIARAIPSDRVATILPLLAEMRGWLDRERDERH